jgi:hypothetical protein
MVFVINGNQVGFVLQDAHLEIIYQMVAVIPVYKDVLSVAALILVKPANRKPI